MSPTAAKGQFLGPLLNTNGTPLTIPGLRSIHFGPGLGDSGHTHVALLFTAETDILTSVSIAGTSRSTAMITPTDVKLPTGTATGTGGISNIQQMNGKRP